jgi:hypothetical protein
MDNKSEKIDFSFLKMFEYLLNFYTFYFLVFGLFLFDSLKIMFYGKGIFDTDFSVFFNLSAIPFLLLFLFVFGAIATGLSSLANLYVPKFINFLSNKIKPLLIRLFGNESKSNKSNNFYNVSSLLNIALTTENTFLLKYIDKELKIIRNTKRSLHVIYSLSIAVILNCFVTFLYDKKTILNFIISLYKNNGFSFINICLTLLLLPFILAIFSGLNQSFTFDDRVIDFPDEKFNLLNKEMKSLLRK